MSAQMRIQFPLPFVEFETHDSVFGITPTDGHYIMQSVSEEVFPDDIETAKEVH